MSEGEVAAKPAKASSSEIAAIKQQIKKQRESLKDLGSSKLKSDRKGGREGEGRAERRLPLMRDFCRDRR